MVSDYIVTELVSSPLIGNKDKRIEMALVNEELQLFVGEQEFKFSLQFLSRKLNKHNLKIQKLNK